MENNLEDIFKNKFTNYRPEVPSNIWPKITKFLHKLILKRIIMIISVSAVLILSFIYLITINQNDKNNIKKITNSTYTITNLRKSKINKKIATKNKISYNNILKQNNKNTIHITVDKKIIVNKTKILPQNKKTADSNIIKTFTLSEKKGCSPLNIIISGDVKKSKNIKWEINGTEYYNKNKIEVTFDKAGTYPISLIKNIKGKKIIYTDSVTVYEKPHADIIIPSKIEIGKQIIFENNSKYANNYQWFINGNLVSKAENLVYNFYSSKKIRLSLVAIDKNNCTDTINKIITIEKQKEYINFPTAFSPDIFGSCNGYYNTSAKYTNNVFRPYIFDKKVVKYNLKIFNRRGKMIFESNNLNQGWDGYFENKLVPIDVYVYVANGVFDDGSTFSKQGSITVIYNNN